MTLPVALQPSTSLSLPNPYTSLNWGGYTEGQRFPTFTSTYVDPYLEDARKGVPTPGVTNPFANMFSNIGKNTTDWFKETPWMGKHGIFDTGVGLAQAFQGYKSNKALISKLKTEESAIKQSMGAQRAAVGETYNRQGRLRAVNAGMSAPQAYAAGDKYELEKMAKWGA